MAEWFSQFDPIVQTLIGTGFTYAVTALGAAMVFFFKSIHKSVLNAMLGFAAGIMIAASFWSLLEPSIEMAGQMGAVPWVPAAVGFLAGGLFLFATDKLMPHLHLGFADSGKEGIKTSWKRSVLLVLAITLHNIPEGLAVGVAFGAAANGLSSASAAGAVTLALGIGLQNFPEGAAVSIPLRREGFSRKKAFFYGQMSGIVEPIAGVIGAAAVVFIRPMLPYALAFAAGAMIYVVVEELIPEAQNNDAPSRFDVASLGVMLGFALMMVLDVALG